MSLQNSTFLRTFLRTLPKKLLIWLDQHGLFSLSLFLLVFIPLYPKIPLLEAIPGYLVRVRLEDILVLLTGLVYLIQLLRQKITWKTSFHFLILAYAVAGLLSLAVAAFLQQTIPLQLIHLSKSLLHYLRYLEYFALFLFMHAGIKSKRHAQITLVVLTITLNLIFIYGLGQRYLQWPAFSTMNREYSKGQLLILNPADKLQATFGGHYDLAAWLIIILPLVFTWILSTGSLAMQLWLGVSLLSGGWLLLESGSKTALAGLLIALLLPSWLWLKNKFGRKKAQVVLLGGAGTLGIITLTCLWFWQRPRLYQLAPFLRPLNSQTPIDATAIQGDETWSLNARKYGLSMGIRLDTLWPQALAGFSLNPYTGKGYATLNRKGETEFTEADGADNNFLRTLGETGLFGFTTFFGVIILLVQTLRLKPPQDKLNQTLRLGFLSATIGLLINAFIIDVFAASKVAFTYWAMAGLTLKSFTLENKKIVTIKEQLRFHQLMEWLKTNWPVLISGIVLILLVHKRPFTEYSLIKSFAQNTPAAKYVALTKCWVETQAYSACTLEYRPGWGVSYSLYLLPFYLLYHQPAMFYFANLFLIISSLILINHLLKKFSHEQIFNFLLLLIIVTTPSFYNLATQSIPLNLYLFLLLFFLSKLWHKTRPLIPKMKISQPMELGLLFITLIHLGLVQYFVNMRLGILASWRDTYRPSNFVAVRRANRYLPTRVFANQPLPILLTTLNPILFDLYGQNNYQLAPLEKNKLAFYQDLLQAQTQELYITNANVTQTQTMTETFASYKNSLGIALREIDCRQECNYYQLLAKEVEIPSQPQTWNNLPILPKLTNPRILVIDDQVVAQIGSGLIFTPAQKLLKEKILAQKPELLFISSNFKERRMADLGLNFIKRLQPELKVPIVIVPHDSLFTQGLSEDFKYQRFAIGENWYVTLDAAAHHTSPAQNVFLYDTLLQLEKHPEIKKVYFIAANNQWLQPHPDNFYFWEDFPKALEKFTGVEFKFIYPQNLELEQI